MKRRSLCLSVLACAAVMAVPAHAQSGSRLDSQPPLTPTDPFSDDGIRILLDKFAACVISRHRKAVESYLETPPDSRESDRKWTSIALPECLSIGTLTLTDAGFRGAAYGRLYKSDFGKKGPEDFTSVPAVDYAAGLDPSRPVDRTNIGIRALADCMARTAPVAAKSLILSRIASKEEKAAFSALGSAGAPCMRQGVTISFSKAALRALVGETLYRLSAASRAAPAGGS
jgi:hypothetical protein